MPFPDFPFVATNWDIGHCSTYAFPELVYNNNFYFRNKFYTEVLPKALLVLCESETGKQELLDYTTVGKHKIRIVPMFAGNVSTLKISESTSYLTLCNLGIEKRNISFTQPSFGLIRIIIIFYRHFILSGRFMKDINWFFVVRTKEIFLM